MTKVKFNPYRTYIFDIKNPSRTGLPLKNQQARDLPLPEGHIYVLWNDEEVFGIGPDSDSPVIPLEICEMLG